MAVCVIEWRTCIFKAYIVTSRVKLQKKRILPIICHEVTRVDYRYSSIHYSRKLYEGRWSTPRAGCFSPRKEYQYPMHRALSGPQGKSGRAWRGGKSLSPTIIRTVNRTAFGKSPFWVHYLKSSYKLCNLFLHKISDDWLYFMSSTRKKVRKAQL